MARQFYAYESKFGLRCTRSYADGSVGPAGDLVAFATASQRDAWVSDDPRDDGYATREVVSAARAARLFGRGYLRECPFCDADGEII